MERIGAFEFFERKRSCFLEADFPAFEGADEVEAGFGEAAFFAGGGDDGGGGDAVWAGEFLEVGEGFGEGGEFGPFAFEEVEAVGAGVWDDEVDFVAFVVAVEEDLVVEAAVVASAEPLAEGEGFEVGAEEGALAEGFGGVDVGEEAHEAGVEEVDFGGFDEALAEVAVPWLEEGDDVGGFEGGEPGFEGGYAEADVCGEGVEGEDLAAAEGEEAEEALEVAEVADLDELADVPLEVGGGVVGVEAAGV